MPGQTAAAELFDALPRHLAERCRPLRESPDAGGEFVLYWMHHAARGHENPALDAAIEAANRLGLPVLVYQGLGGRHRFNSDRHHRFIMEGARDAAAELAERGVRHVFHLPEDPATPSPLRELARRAAVLVVEEYPAPPFPAWVEQLMGRCGCTVWSVDAACVVPMQSVETAHDRAFKFRDEIKGELRTRLNTMYSESACEDKLFDGELPFAPVDLAEADLDALCARCLIDHTLGAIAHTPGGSVAGYERWESFKSRGLKAYAKKRNNAAIDGVSRMSPYLHHGQVSPLRIAREANAERGEGAEKFLDELIVWRELAHNFCFHRVDDLEELSVLPSWARKTLTKHADDERPAVYSWETLARGRTGDRLWDAAQRSLLRQGELHNNVRMTWAKAIVEWTRGPRDAMAKLIDLNHRFSLDGNDPNSYGGLLWALGALDRPFKPEKPIMGTVRPRDTATHLKRIDIEGYESRVDLPAEGRVRRIALVGMGMAGTAAARTLADQGHAVVGFDKARGPGGRMSTRRSSASVYDHGAQYFTARDERTRLVLESWVQDGIAAAWDARFASFEEGELRETEGGGRFVGVPGMNRVVEHLCEDVEVRWGVRVGRVEAIDPGENGGAGWRLFDADGAAIVGENGGSFDELVVATPAPQARGLLEGVGTLLTERLEEVGMTPTLTAMVTPERAIDVGADAIRFGDHPVLGYAARLASKPGVDADATSWTLHANHAWSAEHLEEDPAACARTVFEAFCEAFGVEAGEPIELQGHRWRYAFVDAAAGESCLRDEALRLTLCGDWCLGPRIESAYLSGTAAAGRVLAAGAPDRVRHGAMSS